MAAVAEAAVAADGGVKMKDIVQLGILFAASAGLAAAEPARFDTPEAAVAALVAALEAGNGDEVLQIFGPENQDVVSVGDAEQDREAWGAFLAEAQTITRIGRQADDVAILYVGRDVWPFPAPLVLGEAGWSFDAEAAREEVLARRIGRNELEVIDIMRRAPEIQAAYRHTDHDGDGVLEFAASILSSPGQRDGLYWPDEPGAASSPFDRSMARASFTGYSEDGEDRDPDPYAGYYFRILQGQGPSAPGGDYSYMVNGNMVAGHALIAYPAAYGDTGIMSFVVGEQGIVYEADLGEETLSRAADIAVFDPGEEWATVE